MSMLASAQDTNQTDDGVIPFISDQLDEFFSGLGLPVFIILSLTGIILGLVLAFLGAVDKGKPITAFVAGGLTGCFFAAVIMESISSDIELELWVSIFFLMGILFGVLCACLTTFTKILLGIALGLVFTAFLVSTGLGSAIGENYAFIIFLVISCIAGIAISCKVMDIVFALLASGLGGAFLILGIGYFTESEISLNTFVSNPAVVTACTEESCLIPLIIGGIVTLLSLFLNFRRYFKQKKKKKDLEKKQKEESEKLVREMRQNRLAMEKKVDALANNNDELLKKMDQDAQRREQKLMQGLQTTLQRTQKDHQDELSRIEDQLVKQQHEAQRAQRLAQQQQEEVKAALVKQEEEKRLEREKLDAVERERREAEDRLKQAEMEKIELLKKVEENKSDLEIELEREKLQMAERQAELEREQEKERREQEKLDEEAEAQRRAEMLKLEEEIRLAQVRIAEVEEEVKDNNKLEKRLKLKVDANSDDMSIELSERAQEFAKYKELVQRTRKMQKESLKHVKKAIKDVEKLGANMKKEKKKVKADDADEVRKEKERAAAEMTSRMETVRALLERYEANSDALNSLVEEMTTQLEEFKKEEKRIEDLAAELKAAEEAEKAAQVSDEPDEDDVEAGVLREVVVRVPLTDIERQERLDAAREAWELRQREAENTPGTAELFREAAKYLKQKKNQFRDFFRS